MAVKIRLKRTGGRNDACYRVVAADVRSPRDGKNLETLGWYDPGANGKTYELKLDRIEHWVGVGAQLSDTVASLVKQARNAPATPVEEPVAEQPAEPEKPVVEAPETDAEAAPAEEAPETDAN
jgi:small subunit ribosomal protein S16